MDMGFVQNTKNFKEYESALDEENLPIIKGHKMSPSEAFRSENNSKNILSL
jgi:coproporphyrinogen III oxidase-like Fe-S oxidoreductase